MVISCDDCSMQQTSACGECVVTHILNTDGAAVVFDLPTERAVRLLVEAGLVPRSRHRTGRRAS